MRQIPDYKIAIVKFNGGNGALLCNECQTIISRGFDHLDRAHFCEKCLPTFATAALARAAARKVFKSNSGGAGVEGHAFSIWMNDNGRFFYSKGPIKPF